MVPLDLMRYSIVLLKIIFEAIRDFCLFVLSLSKLQIFL